MRDGECTGFELLPPGEQSKHKEAEETVGDGGLRARCRGRDKNKTGSVKENLLDICRT